MPENPRMPKNKTILVADGDRRDRELIAGVLREHGYTVFEAADYDEAVEIHAQHPGHVDLLLTALALPSDNGYELARSLFRDDAHLKTLFMSGRAGAVVGPYYHMPIAGPHLLTKPLHADELLQKVRDALRSRILRLKTSQSG